MKNKYSTVKKMLENQSLEGTIRFLKSYSSKLGEPNFHCKDLVDSGTKIPFITSVLASGLNVINNTSKSSAMSEEVHQKGKNIIGYIQSNPSHNYTQDEIMFTLGYIELYYKKETYNSVA